MIKTKSFPNSSNVLQIAYDEQQQTLEVDFKNGSMYWYQCVPPSIWAGAITTESIGKFLQPVFRDNKTYPCIKRRAGDLRLNTPASDNILLEPFPMQGSNYHYLLRFLGDKNNDRVAEITDTRPYTWQEIMKEAIDWCRAQNICLHELSERGVIQEGYNGPIYLLPDEAKAYIARYMLGTESLETLSTSNPAISKALEIEDDAEDYRGRGALLITDERIHQINELGFDNERDDQYVNGELVIAAKCYFDVPGVRQLNDEGVPLPWAAIGWGARWWKSDAPRWQQLVYSGALYTAERDRLSRLPVEEGYQRIRELNIIINLIGRMIDVELQQQPEQSRSKMQVV